MAPETAAGGTLPTRCPHCVRFCLGLLQSDTPFILSVGLARCSAEVMLASGVPRGQHNTFTGTCTPQTTNSSLLLVIPAPHRALCLLSRRSVRQYPTTPHCGPRPRANAARPPAACPWPCRRRPDPRVVDTRTARPLSCSPQAQARPSELLLPPLPALQPPALLLPRAQLAGSPALHPSSPPPRAQPSLVPPLLATKPAHVLLDAARAARSRRSAPSPSAAIGTAWCVPTPRWPSAPVRFRHPLMLTRRCCCCCCALGRTRGAAARPCW